LITALVLAVLDFSKQFVVETDASDQSIGVVLMQDQHLVAYLSKALEPRNQALLVYEKECMAILPAIENGDHISNISLPSLRQIIGVCSSL
jgi:hypothetical protein